MSGETSYDSGLRAACDGTILSDEQVDFHDRMRAAWQAYRWLDDHETRRRLHREDVAVRALVRATEAAGDLELAAFDTPEHRAGDEDTAEAMRLARDHGFDSTRLIALRGLARSRGVPLEDVLRAALRGELRSIVERPAPAREAR